MSKIGVTELREGFKGKEFYKLIEHHLDRQKCRTEQLQKAVFGTILLLPPGARSLVEDFIDKWNAVAYDPMLWHMDTDIIFDRIIEDASRVLEKHGMEPDDETLFNMFQIIVLSYAYSASDQPKMREFIGIKKRTWFGQW